MNALQLNEIFIGINTRASPKQGCAERGGFGGGLGAGTGKSTGSSITGSILTKERTLW